MPLIFFVVIFWTLPTWMHFQVQERKSLLWTRIYVNCRNWNSCGFVKYFLMFFRIWKSVWNNLSVADDDKLSIKCCAILLKRFVNWKRYYFLNQHRDFTSRRLQYQKTVSTIVLPINWPTCAKRLTMHVFTCQNSHKYHSFLDAFDYASNLLW